MHAARGVVDSDGPSVRAVTAGPVTIHAFSAFSGVAVFAAPAATGGDADCEAARAGHLAREEPLAPERRLVFQAGPGETVCMSTSTRRGAELLWHAVAAPAPAASAPVLTAKGGRGVAP
jgi:hypothetical protein